MPSQPQFATDGRPIGPKVVAECDIDGCSEEINRGFNHECESSSCERFVCHKHMGYIEGPDYMTQVCVICAYLEVGDRETIQ